MSRTRQVRMNDEGHGCHRTFAFGPLPFFARTFAPGIV